MFSCFSERSTLTSRRVVLRTTASSSDSLNCERPSRRGEGTEGGRDRSAGSVRGPQRGETISTRSEGARSRGRSAREGRGAHLLHRHDVARQLVSAFEHHAVRPLPHHTHHLVLIHRARRARLDVAPARAPAPSPPGPRVSNGRPARRSLSDETAEASSPGPRGFFPRRRHKRLRARRLARRRAARSARQIFSETRMSQVSNRIKSPSYEAQVIQLEIYEKSCSRQKVHTELPSQIPTGKYPPGSLVMSGWKI